MKRPDADTTGAWPLHTPTFRVAPASKWAAPVHLNKFSSARRKWTTAAKISLVQSRLAWAMLEHATFLSFSRPKSSLRLLFGRKENSSRRCKTWVWGPVDRSTLTTLGNNMADRRVVITGMGVITPLGNNLETFWSNLRNGVSGIHTIDAFDTAGYDCKIGG